MIENIVIYQGEQWVVTDRMIVQIRSSDGGDHLERIVNIEKLEPGPEGLAATELWVRLDAVTGLLSNMQWQKSEWSLGIMNGLDRDVS